MSEKEWAFCEVLDGAAHYVKVRQQLDQSLKAGHLKLARARYAMGPGSISSANYSSVMQAKTMLTGPQAGGHPFQLTGASCAGSSCPSICPGAEPRVTAREPTEGSSSTGDQAQGSTLTMQAETKLSTTAASAPGQASELNTADTYSSDAISQLAAKFDAAHVDSASSADKAVASQDPLKWFGFMVSPHLRQAQADFTKAVALLVDVANAQHRIATSLKALTDSQHVDDDLHSQPD